MKPLDFTREYLEMYRTDRALAQNYIRGIRRTFGHAFANEVIGLAIRKIFNG